LANPDSSVHKAMTHLDPAKSSGHWWESTGTFQIDPKSLQAFHGEPFGPAQCAYVSKDDDGFCQIATTGCNEKDLKDYECAFICDVDDGRQELHSFGKFDMGPTEVLDTKVQCLSCKSVPELKTGSQTVPKKKSQATAMSIWIVWIVSVWI